MKLNLRCFTYKGKLWHYSNNKMYRVIFSNIQSLDRTSPGWDKSFTTDFTLIDIEAKTENISFINTKNKIIVKLEDDVFAERWYGEW